MIRRLVARGLLSVVLAAALFSLFRLPAGAATVYQEITGMEELTSGQYVLVTPLGDAPDILLGEDFVISATDAGAQKLTATVVTQKGEKYEVECEYLQISGSMTLLQTGDGRYYAGHGSGVVVLQYTYESDHVSYTLYSEPITITSEKENAAEPQGGCNSSLISGVLIVSSLVIISAIAAIGRKKG